MDHPTHRIDGDIVNLDGGIFAALPQQEIPLSAFRLNDKVIEPAVDDFAKTLEMRRVKLDSLTPVALTGPVIEHEAPPAPTRPVPWSLGVGAVIGAACVAAIGAFTQAKPASAPAPVQAAAVVAAPEVETPAAAPAPVAAPEKVSEASEAAPVKAIAPKAEPVKAVAPAKVAAAVAPAAPVPAAAPVSTADLPMEMPEIPAAPKAPQVQFNASAAAVTIAGAGLRAQACKDMEGSMAVPVSVTFAASGRATKATINGGPFAGTPAGSCIAQALRGVTVPAFDGEPVTVNTTVHLR